MKNDSSQSGWWGKGAAVAVVLALGGVAAAPYLVAASKGLAEDGKVSVEKVVKDAQGEMRKKERDTEIKTAAWSADGQLYVGGKGGLSILKDGKTTAVADFPGDEAKAIAFAQDGTLWVAGKKGLYQLKEGKWSVEKDGDMHSVSIGQGGTIVAVAKRGIYSRDAAGKWTELLAAPPEEEKEKEEKEKHGKDEHEKKEHGKESH